VKALVAVGAIALASSIIAAQSQVDRLPGKPAPPVRPVIEPVAPQSSTPTPARLREDAKPTATPQGSGRSGATGPTKPPPLPSPEVVDVQPGNGPVAATECSYADAEVKTECLAALRENYLYNVAALQHRRASFEWSLIASEIMFFMVLVMVLAGLVFAAIQFRSSAPTPTDLEISTTGLKVSSSVLGVVILAMSMAFFYVYTRYVYPIQEVHHDSVETSDAAGQ
jgi:hypothetical protein